MISPIGYTSYSYPAAGASLRSQTVNPIHKINGVNPVKEKSSENVGKVTSSECQTCKNRKYVDRSNENNVSFKSPAHVTPESSYAAVTSHESEHVSNAVREGSKEGNRLVSASVSLKMDICPECGTPYVAGGTTRTQIEYNVKNPYENSRKSLEEGLLKGRYVDYVA